MTQLRLRDDAPPGPAPLVHPENASFWEGLQRGQFVLQRCDECGVVRFPIAPCCWRCLSTHSHWESVDGDGTVAVAVRIERAVGSPEWQDAVPFLTGLIDTNAGVRVPGRILCSCGEAAGHGTPVTMVCLPARDDTVVYGFQHDCPEHNS